METNFSQRNFFKCKIVLFSIFYYFKHFSKNQRFKKINQNLENHLKKRYVDRIILKGKIMKMLRIFCRTDAKSLFIPKDYKSRCEIRERIYVEFGAEMQKLNISINSNLVIKE
jgi:hypothetical protein